ncbi:glycoside hydrolase family 18 [Alistipes sp.]|uniref:glycoside hydrolase family 18 n=1 Tax=Alistipes sp. TaxID=1872444 RepID=UPI003AF033E5
MKNILIPALAAAALLASCSDWTEAENKDYLPQLRQPDPAYLASLRDFKADENGHKVVMMTVQGTSAAPNRQNKHPTAMPDSVDYLLMTDVDDLHPTIAAELSEVRSSKGTQSLNVVDYAVILDAWKALKEAAADTEHESDYTDEKFPAYCKAQAEQQLANCNRYGFDGVVVSYTTSPVDEIADGQATFMAAVKTWRQSNPHMLLFMRTAYMPNLLSPELLPDSKFIILVADASRKTASDLTLWARNHLRDTRDKFSEEAFAKFSDRFVMEASIPSLETGVQSGASVQVTAEWVVDPTPDTKISYQKRGLCVLDGANDYFDNLTNYKNIREAIGILNPENDNDNENEHE